MKTLIAIAVLMTGAAFAQSGMSCYSLTHSTTICEFSDGRANVSTLIGGVYESTDYTAAEWTEAKPAYTAATQAVVTELQKQAAAWHAVALSHASPKVKCEAAGGSWKSTRFNKCQMPKGGR